MSQGVGDRQLRKFHQEGPQRADQQSKENCRDSELTEDHNPMVFFHLDLFESFEELAGPFFDRLFATSVAIIISVIHDRWLAERSESGNMARGRLTRMFYFTACENESGLELWVLRPDDSIPGDINSDGILTASDLDLISAAVGTQNLKYDLNDDLTVTAEDRRVWIEEIFGRFVGDTNLDRKVDFRDFLLLSSNFGSEAGWEEGDFDGDGSVSFADFLLLSSNFGKSK